MAGQAVAVVVERGDYLTDGDHLVYVLDLHDGGYLVEDAQTLNVVYMESERLGDWRRLERDQAA